MIRSDFLNQKMFLAATIFLSIITSIGVAENISSLSRDINSPPTVNELGKICYRDGTEKQITTEDAIWLAKMIDGETWGQSTQDDAKAMLWTLIQRTAIWNFKGWTLQRMAQGYSQPINPIWTRNGIRCKEYYQGGFNGEISENCSEKRVLRRERNIAKQWHETDETARQSVLDFAAGLIPNDIIGAVGWFAPGTWRSREKNGANKKENMVFHSEIDGNIYYSMTLNPDTTSWKGTEVMVVGPAISCSKQTER